MKKLQSTLILIIIILIFGFLGYKIATIFKKEKSTPKISNEVALKEIKAKVISFKEARESILVKKEDNLENLNVTITNDTIILNEKGIILEKTKIDLGMRVKLELEEKSKEIIAKKYIY